jgi:DNA-binding XRE family transcriptional regulator
MHKRKKLDFDYIDKARIEAGFFIGEACEKLGISKSTWYRWKQEKACPEWALNLMELLSGKLDYLGWKNWKIERGVLYRTDLNPKYYNWEAPDLMVSVFCDCPAHQRIRERLRPITRPAALRLASGNRDSVTGKPLTLVTESQSYPAENNQGGVVAYWGQSGI